VALNVNCKFGNLCCHSFQNLTGVSDSEMTGSKDTFNGQTNRFGH